MNGKNWLLAAVSATLTRRYPAPWTALLFAALPVLLRFGSAQVGGSLLLCVGDEGVRCAPFIGAAAFLASLIGFLKYGSRGDALAYGLWVVTFLSVAVLGIVMFEAFSAPEQWSGSLALPGIVVLGSGAGIAVGACLRALRQT